MDLSKAIDKVKAMFPKLSISNESLLSLLNKYEINTPNRLAGFFSQCATESGEFRAKTENLNYSAKALRSVFGKYFKTDADANACARQPEKIANICYANRMGNGDTASGEGWKYRGRGYIQLTGKNNYKTFADSLSMSLEDAITYLETDDGALESALHYWDKCKLNVKADKDDIVGISKSVNGGTNGLEERKSYYAKIKAAVVTAV